LSRDLKLLQKLAKESQSANPLTKLKVALAKRGVQIRVDSSIRDKILERLGTMENTNMAPSGRKTLSVLDLMLREMSFDKRSLRSEKEIRLLITK
jgi:hypothetical protein